MVQNLNILSFASYGNLLTERPGGVGLPKGPHWEERLLTATAQETYQYLSSDSVYLDYESGMSILAVAKEGEEFQYFYLDKPVCVYPGVRFAIAPYQDSCTVHMMARRTSWPQAEPLTVSVRELALSRRLQVERVYTFFYHEKERGFFFRGEEHSMLELTYVDKGSIHSVAGGQDLVLTQGDMAIYGPNQWHMQYADPDCAPSYITITFDLEGDSLERLLNRKFRTPQKAVLLLQQMLRERDREDRYTGDMLISLLGQLLLTVLREAEGSARLPLRTANAINNENEVVGHAQRFIGQNVRMKLSVPMVAREVGVSPSYLTALFHKNLQISPVQTAPQPDGGHRLSGQRLPDPGGNPWVRCLRGGDLQRRKAADGVQACHLHRGPRAAAVLGGGSAAINPGRLPAGGPGTREERMYP